MLLKCFWGCEWVELEEGNAARDGKLTLALCARRAVSDSRSPALVLPAASTHSLFSLSCFEHSESRWISFQKNRAGQKSKAKQKSTKEEGSSLPSLLPPFVRKNADDPLSLLLPHLQLRSIPTNLDTADRGLALVDVDTRLDDGRLELGPFDDPLVRLDLDGRDGCTSSREKSEKLSQAEKRRGKSVTCLMSLANAGGQGNVQQKWYRGIRGREQRW